MKQRSKLPLLRICIWSLFSILGVTTFAQERPNILLIVADDLNYDSLGFADGGVAPEISPNIDSLREQSISFERAFVTVAVCQPSRQSMLTGLMPHNYGAVGFFPIKNKVDTLPALLKEAGYVTANIHKKHHMVPTELFPWDFDNAGLGLNDPDGYIGRDPDAFVQGLERLINHGNDKEAPFLLVANSADPHRPFYGDSIKKNSYYGYKSIPVKTPSRVYSRDEVTIPPTLPDLPGIREDLAKYASSVRRLDDMVGACLQVLEETGKVDSTIVVFVSDNGMPLPFGKFDTYLGSNQTPLLMRIPQKSVAGRVDENHFVSLMDLTPTLLELVGLTVPDGLDGRSLMPILDGQEVSDWREEIVLIRYEDIYYRTGYEKRAVQDPEFMGNLWKLGWKQRPDHPSKGTLSRDKQQRCYFDGRYGYIFNDWYRPNGLELDPLGVGVPYPDRSFYAMVDHAEEDEQVAERVREYLLRAPEELYDWQKDPGSQVNLVDNPDYADVLNDARENLRQWMVANNDPVQESYLEKVVEAK